MCLHTDNVPAIEISGTGARTVTVNNPVVLNSSITCGDIKSTGTPGVKILKSDGGIAVKVYDSGTTQFYSNVIMDWTLSVTGNVNLKMFLPLKPWFGFLVLTDTAGVVTISKHIGYNTTGISCAHANNGGYDFTHPAHPNGANLLLIVSSYSPTTATVSTITTGISVSATRKLCIVKKNAVGSLTSFFHRVGLGTES